MEYFDLPGIIVNSVITNLAYYFPDDPEYDMKHEKEGNGANNLSLDDSPKYPPPAYTIPTGVVPFAASGPLAKGWKDDAPKRGTERHQLKAQHGNKCFLLPEKEKFPVCNTSGQYDCRGIQAAYGRARQWGYSEVAEKALQLRSQYCGR